jgi:hypothetical protein
MQQQYHAEEDTDALLLAAGSSEEFVTAADHASHSAAVTTTPQPQARRSHPPRQPPHIAVWAQYFEPVLCSLERVIAHCRAAPGRTAPAAAAEAATLVQYLYEQGLVQMASCVLLLSCQTSDMAAAFHSNAAMPGAACARQTAHDCPRSCLLCRRLLVSIHRAARTFLGIASGIGPASRRNITRSTCALASFAHCS